MLLVAETLGVVLEHLARNLSVLCVSLISRNLMLQRGGSLQLTLSNETKNLLKSLVAANGIGLSTSTQPVAVEGNVLENKGTSTNGNGLLGHGTVGDVMTINGQLVGQASG